MRVTGFALFRVLAPPPRGVRRHDRHGRTLHDATGSVDASIAPKPRRRVVRWIGAALALVILAAGGFIVASYTEASRLERAVAADVRAVDAADPEKLTEADLRAFGALMSRVADLESIATAPPLLLRLLFDAPKTLVSVRAARDAFVSRELDHRKRVLEAQLGAAGRDGLRYEADYDGLKLYVALTDRARAKGERAYLEADLAATIQGEMASPVAPEVLAPLVHALADAAEAGAIVPDKPTLASAREKLSPALNEAALLGLALAPLTTAADAYPAWRPFERQPALLALFGEPAQVGIAPEYTTKARAAVLASLGKLPARRLRAPSSRRPQRPPGPWARRIPETFARCSRSSKGARRPPSAMARSSPSSSPR